MFCFSLKLECEKLASEKIEIQRHYVMVSNKIIEISSADGNLANKINKKLEY